MISVAKTIVEKCSMAEVAMSENHITATVLVSTAGHVIIAHCKFSTADDGRGLSTESIDSLPQFQVQTQCHNLHPHLLLHLTPHLDHIALQLPHHPHRHPRHHHHIPHPAQVLPVTLNALQRRHA